MKQESSEATEAPAEEKTSQETQRLPSEGPATHSPAAGPTVKPAGVAVDSPAASAAATSDVATGVVGGGCKFFTESSNAHAAAAAMEGLQSLLADTSSDEEASSSTVKQAGEAGGRRRLLLSSSSSSPSAAAADGTAALTNGTQQDAFSWQQQQQLRPSESHAQQPQAGKLHQAQRKQEQQLQQEQRRQERVFPVAPAVETEMQAGQSQQQQQQWLRSGSVAPDQHEKQQHQVSVEELLQDEEDDEDGWMESLLNASLLPVGAEASQLAATETATGVPLASAQVAAAAVSQAAAAAANAPAAAASSALGHRSTAAGEKSAAAAAEGDRGEEEGEGGRSAAAGNYSSGSTLAHDASDDSRSGGRGFFSGENRTAGTATEAAAGEAAAGEAAAEAAAAAATEGGNGSAADASDLVLRQERSRYFSLCNTPQYRAARAAAAAGSFSQAVPGLRRFSSAASNRSGFSPAVDGLLPSAVVDAESVKTCRIDSPRLPGSPQSSACAELTRFLTARSEFSTPGTSPRLRGADAAAKGGGAGTSWSDQKRLLHLLQPLVSPPLPQDLGDSLLLLRQRPLQWTRLWQYAVWGRGAAAALAAALRVPGVDEPFFSRCSYTRVSGQTDRSSSRSGQHQRRRLLLASASTYDSHAAGATPARKGGSGGLLFRENADDTREEQQQPEEKAQQHFLFLHRASSVGGRQKPPLLSPHAAAAAEAVLPELVEEAAENVLGVTRSLSLAGTPAAAGAHAMLLQQQQRGGAAAASHTARSSLRSEPQQQGGVGAPGACAAAAAAERPDQQQQQRTVFTTPAGEQKPVATLELLTQGFLSMQFLAKSVGLPTAFHSVENALAVGTSRGFVLVADALTFPYLSAPEVQPQQQQQQRPQGRDDEPGSSEEPLLLLLPPPVGAPAAVEDGRSRGPAEAATAAAAETLPTGGLAAATGSAEASGAAAATGSSTVQGRRAPGEGGLTEAAATRRRRQYLMVRLGEITQVAAPCVEEKGLGAVACLRLSPQLDLLLVAYKNSGALALFRIYPARAQSAQLPLGCTYTSAALGASPYALLRPTAATGPALQPQPSSASVANEDDQPAAPSLPVMRTYEATLLCLSRAPGAAAASRRSPDKSSSTTSSTSERTLFRHGSGGSTDVSAPPAFPQQLPAGAVSASLRPAAASSSGSTAAESRNTLDRSNSGSGATGVGGSSSFCCLAFLPHKNYHRKSDTAPLSSRQRTAATSGANISTRNSNMKNSSTGNEAPSAEEIAERESGPALEDVRGSGSSRSAAAAVAAAAAAAAAGAAAAAAAASAAAGSWWQTAAVSARTSATGGNDAVALAVAADERGQLFLLIFRRALLAVVCRRQLLSSSNKPFAFGVIVDVQPVPPPPAVVEEAGGRVTGDFFVAAAAAEKGGRMYQAQQHGRRSVGLFEQHAADEARLTAVVCSDAVLFFQLRPSVCLLHRQELLPFFSLDFPADVLLQRQQTSSSSDATRSERGELPTKGQSAAAPPASTDTSRWRHMQHQQQLSFESACRVQQQLLPDLPCVAWLRATRVSRRLFENPLLLVAMGQQLQLIEIQRQQQPQHEQQQQQQQQQQGICVRTWEQQFTFPRPIQSLRGIEDTIVCTLDSQCLLQLHQLLPTANSCLQQHHHVAGSGFQLVLLQQVDAALANPVYYRFTSAAVVTLLLQQRQRQQELALQQLQQSAQQRAAAADEKRLQQQQQDQQKEQGDGGAGGGSGSLRWSSSWSVLLRGSSTSTVDYDFSSSTSAAARDGSRGLSSSGAGASGSSDAAGSGTGFVPEAATNRAGAPSPGEEGGKSATATAPPSRPMYIASYNSSLCISYAGVTLATTALQRVLVSAAAAAGEASSHAGSSSEPPAAHRREMLQECDRPSRGAAAGPRPNLLLRRADTADRLAVACPAGALEIWIVGIEGLATARLRCWTEVLSELVEEHRGLEALALLKALYENRLPPLLSFPAAEAPRRRVLQALAAAVLEACCVSLVPFRSFFDRSCSSRSSILHPGQLHHHQQQHGVEQQQQIAVADATGPEAAGVRFSQRSLFDVWMLCAIACELSAALQLYEELNGFLFACFTKVLPQQQPSQQQQQPEQWPLDRGKPEMHGRQQQQQEDEEQEQRTKHKEQGEQETIGSYSSVAETIRSIFFVFLARYLLLEQLPISALQPPLLAAFLRHFERELDAEAAAAVWTSRAAAPAATASADTAPSLLVAQSAAAPVDSTSHLRAGASLRPADSVHSPAAARSPAAASAGASPGGEGAPSGEEPEDADRAAEHLLRALMNYFGDDAAEELPLLLELLLLRHSPLRTALVLGSPHLLTPPHVAGAAAAVARHSAASPAAAEGDAELLRQHRRPLLDGCSPSNDAAAAGGSWPASSSNTTSTALQCPDLGPLFSPCLFVLSLHLKKLAVGEAPSLEGKQSQQQRSGVQGLRHLRRYRRLRQLLQVVVVRLFDLQEANSAAVKRLQRESYREDEICVFARRRDGCSSNDSDRSNSVIGVTSVAVRVSRKQQPLSSCSLPSPPESGSYDALLQQGQREHCTGREVFSAAEAVDLLQLLHLVSVHRMWGCASLVYVNGFDDARGAVELLLSEICRMQHLLFRVYIHWVEHCWLEQRRKLLEVSPVGAASTSASPEPAAGAAASHPAGPPSGAASPPSAVAAFSPTTPRSRSAGTDSGPPAAATAGPLSAATDAQATAAGQEAASEEAAAPGKAATDEDVATEPANDRRAAAATPEAVSTRDAEAVSQEPPPHAAPSNSAAVAAAAGASAAEERTGGESKRGQGGVAAAAEEELDPASGAVANIVEGAARAAKAAAAIREEDGVGDRLHLLPPFVSPRDMQLLRCTRDLFLLLLRCFQCDNSRELFQEKPGLCCFSVSADDASCSTAVVAALQLLHGACCSSGCTSAVGEVAAGEAAFDGARGGSCSSSISLACMLHPYTSAERVVELLDYLLRRPLASPAPPSAAAAAAASTAAAAATATPCSFQMRHVASKLHILFDDASTLPHAVPRSALAQHRQQHGTPPPHVTPQQQQQQSSWMLQGATQQSDQEELPQQASGEYRQQQMAVVKQGEGSGPGAGVFVRTSNTPQVLRHLLLASPSMTLTLLSALLLHRPHLGHSCSKSSSTAGEVLEGQSLLCLLLAAVADSLVEFHQVVHSPYALVSAAAQRQHLLQQQLAQRRADEPQNSHESRPEGTYQEQQQHQQHQQEQQERNREQEARPVGESQEKSESAWGGEEGLASFAVPVTAIFETVLREQRLLLLQLHSVLWQLLVVGLLATPKLELQESLGKFMREVLLFCMGGRPLSLSLLQLAVSQPLTASEEQQLRHVLQTPPQQQQEEEREDLAVAQDQGFCPLKEEEGKATATAAEDTPSFSACFCVDTERSARAAGAAGVSFLLWGGALDRREDVLLAVLLKSAAAAAARVRRAAPAAAGPVGCGTVLGAEAPVGEEEEEEEEERESEAAEDGETAAKAAAAACGTLAACQGEADAAAAAGFLRVAALLHETAQEYDKQLNCLILYGWQQKRQLAASHPAEATDGAAQKAVQSAAADELPLERGGGAAAAVGQISPTTSGRETPSRLQAFTAATGKLREEDGEGNVFSVVQQLLALPAAPQTAAVTGIADHRSPGSSNRLRSELHSAPKSNSSSSNHTSGSRSSHASGRSSSSPRSSSSWASARSSTSYGSRRKKAGVASWRRTLLHRAAFLRAVDRQLPRLVELDCSRCACLIGELFRLQHQWQQQQQRGQHRQQQQQGGHVQQQEELPRDDGVQGRSSQDAGEPSVYKDPSAVIDLLDAHPQLQLQLLDALINGREAVQQQKDRSSSIGSVAFFPSVYEHQAFVAQEFGRYIRLLCKLAPQRVCAALQQHERVPLEVCMRLCEEHGLYDACAALLERTGDIQGLIRLYKHAFSKGLETLRTVFLVPSFNILPLLRALLPRYPSSHLLHRLAFSSRSSSEQKQPSFLQQLGSSSSRYSNSSSYTSSWQDDGPSAAYRGGVDSLSDALAATPGRKLSHFSSTGAQAGDSLLGQKVFWQSPSASRRFSACSAASSSPGACGSPGAAPAGAFLRCAPSAAFFSFESSSPWRGPADSGRRRRSSSVATTVSSPAHAFLPGAAAAAPGSAAVGGATAAQDDCWWRGIDPVAGLFELLESASSMGQRHSATTLQQQQLEDLWFGLLALVVQAQQAFPHILYDHAPVLHTQRSPAAVSAAAVAGDYQLAPVARVSEATEATAPASFIPEADKRPESPAAPASQSSRPAEALAPASLLPPAAATECVAAAGAPAAPHNASVSSNGHSAARDRWAARPPPAVGAHAAAVGSEGQAAGDTGVYGTAGGQQRSSPRQLHPQQRKQGERQHLQTSSGRRTLRGLLYELVLAELLSKILQAGAGTLAPLPALLKRIAYSNRHAQLAILKKPIASMLSSLADQQALLDSYAALANSDTAAIFAQVEERRRRAIAIRVMAPGGRAIAASASTLGVPPSDARSGSRSSSQQSLRSSSSNDAYSYRSLRVAHQQQPLVCMQCKGHLLLPPLPGAREECAAAAESQVVDLLQQQPAPASPNSGSSSSAVAAFACGHVYHMKCLGGASRCCRFCDAHVHFGLRRPSRKALGSTRHHRTAAAGTPAVL